jgi:nucleotide-binding universal stress UspA family protein
VSTQPVVVGIDGSDSALSAAAWAAAIAARRDLPVRLVHAVDLPLVGPPDLVEVERLYEAVREQGQAYLDAANTAGVEAELKDGPVVPTLVEESRQASVLVLGSRGTGGFTGLLVGSIPMAVAGRAHCPVVVVRSRDGEPPPVDGPVVVGVDGTPTSEAAVAFAFAEASARGSDLIAVHAWSDTVIDTVLASGSPVWDFAPAQLHATEILAERLAGWQERYPDVRVTREVVQVRPATALMSHAETAGLVVVGTRGRGGVLGLLLGSTSQQLLQHAPCPVAVVHGVSPDDQAEAAGDPA